MTREAPLRLHLLGGFRAERDGVFIPERAWGRPKAKTLVKILAVEESHRLHREAIQEALWPDVAPEAAGMRLRKTLYLARHALEPDLTGKTSVSCLLVVDDLLHLDTLDVWIDIDHFRGLAGEARLRRNPTAYRAALAAYQGQLLPEDRYEEWSIRPRQELAELNLQLQIQLADLYGRGALSGDEAIELLQSVLKHDPTREDVHRRLIRVFADSGRRQLAIRQYQTCREALRQELEVEPETETETLYRQIRQGRELTGPAEEVKATRRRSEIEAAAPQLPRPARRFPRTSLVGRQRVLELLQSQLRHYGSASVAASEAASDSTLQPEKPKLVLVGGEAGVGKTRLMIEMAHEVDRRGGIVLWGSCYEHEGQTAYGPFVEALEGYVAERTSDEQQDLAEQYPTLKRLLPSLMTFGPDSSTWYSSAVSGSERLALFAAVASLLTQLAAARALLVVLDDLHLADPATLHLLHHLARTDAQARSGARAPSFVLLGTHRREDVPPESQLGRLVADVTRAHLSLRVDLLRLGRPDSDRLVESLLDAELEGVGRVEPQDGEATDLGSRCARQVTERVYELTLGNPLFIGELIRSMLDRQEIAFSRGRWMLQEPEGGALPSLRDREPGLGIATPAGVKALMENRICAMDESVRHALAVTAAAGMESSFALLSATAKEAFPSSMREDTLLDALDEGVASGVLEERQTPTGWGYAFRHPLFRAVVYETLSRPQRLRLHRALAGAMERLQPEDVEALAYHYIRANDDAKAMGYLERAGDRVAAVHANEAAAGHYRSVLDRLATDDTKVVSRVREKLGAVLGVQADYDAALTELDKAARWYRAQGDLEAEGRVLAHMGQIHFHRGTPAEGIALLSPALAGLDAMAPSPAQAEIWLALAHLRFACGDYQELLDASSRAGDLAQALGDQHVLAQAEVRRSTGLQLLGRITESRDTLEHVIPLLESTQDLETLSRALNNLAYLCFIKGDLEGNKAYATRAFDVIQRVGDPVRTGLYLASMGHARWLLGEWPQGREQIERGSAILGRQAPSWHAAYVSYFMGVITVSAGEWEASIHHFGKTVEVARRSGDLQALRAAHHVLSEMDLLETRPRDARARLEPLLANDNQRPQDVQDFDNTLVLSNLAWAHAQMGESAVAGEMAERAVDIARRHESLLHLEEAQRAQGHVLTWMGRWDEAEQAFLASLAAVREMGYVYREACTLEAMSFLCRCQGAPDRAKRLRDDAMSIFRQLGASKRAELSKKLLVQAPQKPL